MSAAGFSRGLTPPLAALLVLVSVALPIAALGAGRVALVIGNAAYKEAPLRNPVNDARAMAATLGSFGFEVILLENATKAKIERAVAQFTQRLDEDSAGLFYYAGHGVQIRGRNYLVPVDARFNSQQEARIESVGVNLVLDELAYAGNRLNIVILDACRNNPFDRRLRGASRGLAAIDAARGTLIAYATAPGSVARDGEGSNGVYTEELLRALDKPGMKIEEVFKHVRINVAHRTNDQQIPWESSSLTGDFVFSPLSANVPLVTPTIRQNEIVFWESTERIGTLGAYRAYLEQFPDGLFAKLAGLRIAELDGGSAQTGGQAAVRAEQSREKPLIAVLEPLVNDFGCNAAEFSEGEVLTRLRDRVEATGMSVNVSRDYGWNVDLDPDDLWRSAGLHKLPISEHVFQHGEVLDVDGMLLSWYSINGSSTCRIDFNLYFFDIQLKRFYKAQATQGDLDSVVDALANEYLTERTIAGVNPQ